jgi:hypothetical protein
MSDNISIRYFPVSEFAFLPFGFHGDWWYEYGGSLGTYGDFFSIRNEGQDTLQHKMLVFVLS